MAWMSFGLPFAVGLFVCLERARRREARDGGDCAARCVLRGRRDAAGWGASCARVVGGWMGARRRFWLTRGVGITMGRHAFFIRR